MRKRIVCLMLVCCMLVAILPGVALGSPEMPEMPPQTFTVIFDGNGGYPVQQTTDVWSGLGLWHEEFEELVTPVREGYRFVGWSQRPDVYLRDFSWAFQDITFYAAWFPLALGEPAFVTFSTHLSADAIPIRQRVALPVGATLGEAIALIEDPIRTGFFFQGWRCWSGESVDPLMVIEFSRTFEANWERDLSVPSFDVPPGSWFSAAVKFVLEHNIMFEAHRGVEWEPSAYFFPDRGMTRFMLGNSMWVMAGNPHADVRWADTRGWARSNGLIRGDGSPNNILDRTLTREEIVTILHRYAQWADEYTPAPEDFCLSTQFTDYDSVSAWAYDAMRWSVYHGLLRGTSQTSLSPRGTVTRAQTAVILMRYMQDI